MYLVEFSKGYFIDVDRVEALAVVKEEGGARRVMFTVPTSQGSEVVDPEFQESFLESVKAANINTGIQFDKEDS